MTNVRPKATHGTHCLQTLSYNKMSHGGRHDYLTLSTVLIGTLQEMQVRLWRIENKQSQMQSCLEELKEMVKVNQEASFKIKGSPFQVPNVLVIAA